MSKKTTSNCDKCGEENGSLPKSNKEECLFEECPICFLRIPYMQTGSKYKTCCGKVICSGCIYAVVEMDDEAKCPFCRTPAPISDEDCNERETKRVEIFKDAEAIYSFGCYYHNGERGFRQDDAKALELWLQAGELGHATSNSEVGDTYYNGRGVERNIKKARYYWDLAAMGGEVNARYNIGCLEGQSGNISRAVEHMLIAVEGGHEKSLKSIQGLFMNGHATKDVYARALRAYQSYLKEVRSDGRDKAARFSDHFKYY